MKLGFLKHERIENCHCEFHPAGGGSLTCEAGRDLSGCASTDFEQRILSNINGIETVETRFPVAGQGMGFIRFRYNPPQP